MNIPEIYLVEPYNAYAPKGRKKHWHEVIEEQALMARILAEQQAQQQAILEAQTRTLPSDAPHVSSATVAGRSFAPAGNSPAGTFFFQAAPKRNYQLHSGPFTTADGCPLRASAQAQQNPG